MQTQTLLADPFAMLISPDEVVAAMQGSDRLRSLARRVCRPLDRPLIPHRSRKEVADYDSAIDAEPEVEMAEEPVDAEDAESH